MNTEKLMNAVRCVKIPKGYRMYPDEALALIDAANGDESVGAYYAFCYGFMKGQRAAKAEARREKKRLMERDTTGWYGYLSRWLERNIDNVRLLDLVGRRAREMEGRQ